MELLCPICQKVLVREDRSCVSAEGHRFDVARQGYVNLLPVQNKRSLDPGDTLSQVRSRRAFLEGGFYAPISKVLNETALRYAPTGEILDVGCGEGYYSVRLAEALGLPLTGVDISKEAVRYAAGAHKNAAWLCASAAHLPVKDGSAGLVTSLFALTLPGEFCRVLGEGGLFFQVLAAEDHLMALKGIIYDTLISKEKDSVPELPGFERLESIPIRFPFTVEGEQVRNLLSMTPHVYRIGKEGSERLAKTQSLTDTASCILNVYRKQS